MSNSIFLALSLSLFCLLTTGPALADSEATARQLLNSQGCKGCHRFEGSGGSLGPPLDRVGVRLNQKQIIAQLNNPRTRNLDSLMPSFSHLKEAQIIALAEFLASRKK